MSGELRRSGDLQRVARELRRMDDAELKKRFRKELRAAAAPLVPKVRAAIRAVPSTRGYSPAGLRGALSQATRLELKTAGRQAGVAIRVDGRKMPSHMKSLPAMLEGKKGFRHPVFGNRDVWVNQTPHPYFYTALRVAGPASRRAVSRVLDGISRDIS
jgi:hypothetical protein